jgi:hypothetical protein
MGEGLEEGRDEEGRGGGRGRGEGLRKVRLAAEYRSQEFCSVAVGD